MIYEKLSKPHSSELPPAYSKNQIREMTRKGERVRILIEILQNNL